MDSIDLEVLHACAQWIRDGFQCEYVTVVRTWGSSQRPEGAVDPGNTGLAEGAH